MALSPIYYARGDSYNAANAELNVMPLSQVPVTSIQFTSGTSGDLLLEQVADDGDADLHPEFDPDTQVIINGQTYNFVFLKSGTLDPARVPAALANDPVYVIKVDMNNDGDVEDAGDLQLFFTTSPDGTITNMTNIQGGALRIGSLDITPPPDPVCFRAGTLIATPSGRRAVESLRPGDMVLTEDGRAVPVAWVGISGYSAAALAADPALRPVRIPAHAFAPGLPERDLDLSPQHRVVLEDVSCELLFGTQRVFVIARHLLGTLAHVAQADEGVRYVHLLLERHEILLAEGLAAESFQPARRMVELMTGPVRDALMQTLDVLGAEAMLSRPDALPTLKSPEAAVLMRHLARNAPLSPAAMAGYGQTGPSRDNSRR